MREYQEVNIVNKILRAKVCDICKQRFTDNMEVQEFTTIYKDGGYASIFGDGLEFEIDICQYCLKRVIDTFDIKVNYIGEIFD